VKVKASSALTVRLVDRVLTFVDKPWKGLLLVVLIVLIGGGYILYSERAQIATAILASHVKPRLELAIFKSEARQLLNDTQADAVMLVQARVADNVAVNIDGLNREGYTFTPIKGPRPMLETDSDMVQWIQFLRNEPVCFDVGINQSSAERRAEARLGIRRACLIAVPPTFGVLVGMLWIGWNVPPAAEVEDRARVIISDAALRFATW
jgi:hypothetical protein